MAKYDLISTVDDVKLCLITPIYRTSNKLVEVDGVKKPVSTQALVKELRTTKWIRKDAITSVDDYITAKNTVSKSRAIIYDKFCNKFFAVEHTPDDLTKALSKTPATKVGFNK